MSAGNTLPSHRSISNRGRPRSRVARKRIRDSGFSGDRNRPDIRLSAELRIDDRAGQ